jgi:hypothetical protein
MKLADEMSLDSMTYIPSFIKIGSFIQKLIAGEYTDTDGVEIA